MKSHSRHGKILYSVKPPSYHGGKHHSGTNMITPDLTADELQRKREFDRLMRWLPDEPRGERIRLAAEWMCSSTSTIYIWAAPNARKVPSETKLALLRREMASRGIDAPKG